MEELELKSLRPKDYQEENQEENLKDPNELSVSEYLDYMIDTQGRAMVPKNLHNKTYKGKKLQHRHTGPYKWLYRQLNHSKDADKNFNFWREELPSNYHNMSRKEFYDMAEKVKNDEDRGIVEVENYKDLEAVNDFIQSLENYSPSTRGGKSRKITKRRRKHRRKHRRTKRNTFLN